MAKKPSKRSMLNAEKSLNASINMWRQERGHYQNNEADRQHIDASNKRAYKRKKGK